VQKQIQAIQFLQKSRELKLHKRPEITDAIRHIALDFNALSSLQPQSYVSALIHAVSKMKIDDPIIWQSLASYVAQRHDQFDIRSLSTIVYALSLISQSKPIELNFDSLLAELELPIIMKLDTGSSDPQSIANTIWAYSKS